jgi:hypothetical protein
MFKLSLGLVSGAALLMLLTYGCSSSDNPSTPATDAGQSPTDGSKPKEAGGDQVDTGIDQPECSPGDVKDFKASWKAPAAFHQGKCTDTQVDALVSCNFDSSADQTTCEKVLKDAANKDCNNCLFVASTAAKLGPVVITGNVGHLNIAGCIANFENDTSASSCGAKYQAAGDCGNEACDTNCTGDDAAALKAKNACIQKALTTVCQDFASAADCANALLDTGGAAEACNAGSSFEEAAAALGKLWCSGAPQDGGAKDAAADG